MQDKSVILKIIEQHLLWYPIIKKEFSEALDEHKHDYKTGGSYGNALISDRTANQAIKEIEPPYISRIYITVMNDRGDLYVKKIANPFKWIRLFEWIKKYVVKDKVQNAVFTGRYVKQELHTSTTSQNGISRQMYFDARAEILYTALAAACQLGLVKIM